MGKINNTLYELEKKGYSIIPNVIKKKDCDFLKEKLEKLHKSLKNNPNFIDEGSKGGQIIIRDLVMRDPKIFLKCISLKKITNILNKIFNDKFILNNIMASNSLNVKNKFNRKIHIDSRLPINVFNLTTDVVATICLDNFEVNNGATKVWPGSQKSGIRIHHANKKITNRKFKHLTAQKGSVAITLGQTWHQVGKNLTNNSRWSILVHYQRWWMKPATDFTRCGSKIYKMLTNEQKELFGFTSIIPKFDFVNKTKKVHTLRKVSSLNKVYYKNFNY